MSSGYRRKEVNRDNPDEIGILGHSVIVKLYSNFPNFFCYVFSLTVQMKPPQVIGFKHKEVLVCYYLLLKRGTSLPKLQSTLLWVK